MTAKKDNGVFNLLLQSINMEHESEIRNILQKLLGVGKGQANDIMDSAPIILLDEIAGQEKADRIKSKFEEAEKLGANIVISEETLEDMPKLRWPEEPDIAKDEEDENRANKNDDVLTLVKYNFTVDRRNVFRCPHCDKLFIIRELTGEEAQEASAQAEIAERLQKGAKGSVATPSEPKSDEQVSSTVSPESRVVEEVEPMQERQIKGGMLSIDDPGLMDLATFEEGLSSIDYDQPDAPELALPPDAKNETVLHEGQAKDFFQELESLPVEGQGEEEIEQQQPSPEAAQKESELEELAPEEAMKFFTGRRDMPEDDSEEMDTEEGKRKIVAPRRGAAKKRMQRLREKQEEKDAGGRKRISGRKKRVIERDFEEEDETVNEVEHTEGFYGVVLSRIGSREKKNKASKLIVEVTGVHPEEARDMVEGTFVNVLRGISEEEANEISARFKEIGVSAKVTLQKRKMRKSGRIRK